ncbi:MAG: isoprenylcysteine carboxylmethyltransferase family protein [bacterium]
MELILFILGTIFLVVFSWKFSVKAGRYHGIYRFFGFESILALLLLNYKSWLSDPASIHQILSVILLTISLFAAIAAFYFFLRLGKSEGQLENTTKLVKIGIYKFIRHPMYASLMLLGTGIFLKSIDLTTTLIAGVNIFALFLTAKKEEKEMVAKFGFEYESYMKRTKMFLPYLF